MTTITTAEELEALPHSAIVVDSRNCPWQKVNVTTEDAPELSAAFLAFGKTSAYTAKYLASYGPFKVLTGGDLMVSKRLPGLTVSGAH